MSAHRGLLQPQATDTDSWADIPSLKTKFWSGFEYSAMNVRVERERILIDVARAELFSSYCAPQTPHKFEPYSVAYVDNLPDYRCITYSSFSVDSRTPEGLCTVSAWVVGEDMAQDATVEINWEQYAMCNASFRGCACTETGCGVDMSTPGLLLDAALDNSQENLAGTLVMDDLRLSVRHRRE